MANSHNTFDLKSLLQKANITKVVAIDDYSCSPDAFLADFSAEWKSDITGSKKNIILNRLGIANGDDDEIVFDSCREQIEQELAGPNRESIISMVKEAFPNINDDQKVYSVISSVLSEAGVDFVEMTPSEWSEKPTISSQPDQRHWILIDKELKKDQNYSGRDGIELLVSEKNKSNNSGNPDLWNNNYISILTHTVEIQTEEESHLGLIEEFRELDIADFCTLSKQRIESPEAFLEGLVISIVNRYTSLIKNAYARKLKDATRKAVDEFERLIPSAIYHATRNKAFAEGCSELEVLRRVFDIRLDRSLGKALEDAEFQMGNRAYFDRLGEVITDNWEPKSGHFREKLREHMHSEYFQGDIINKLNSPITNGDIFHFRNSAYILLAQPCDLMIRGDGSGNNERAQRVVTLYKIVKCQDDLPNSRVNSSELLYWNAKEDRYFIKYKSCLQLNIQVLDLASLNTEGKCFLMINHEVPHLIPPLKGMRRAMENLLQSPAKYVSDHLKKFKDLKLAIKELKNDGSGNSHLMAGKLNELLPDHQYYEKALVAEKFMPIVLNKNLLPDSKKLEKGEVDFKLQRINRLREPFAANQLLLLSQNQARPADPMPMV